MKQKKLPISITTLQALEIALTDKPCILYIENDLYSQHQTQITEALHINRYAPAKKQGKHGFFFVKTCGQHAFDPDIHEIYDPLQIL